MLERGRLDSTNAELRRLGAPLWTAVSALSQTGGRGRLGRRFFSPPGGLYISFAVPMDSGLTLTAKAAVAVARAVREAFGAELRIKWLNDLLLDGRKVAGILAEGFAGRLVVGVGVNVAVPPSLFPEDLRATAGSLFPENAPSGAVRTLREALIESFSAVVDGDGCLEEYRSRLDTLGRQVRVSGGGTELCRGAAVGLTDSYHLLVRREDGAIQEISSGEVTLRAGG